LKSVRIAANRRRAQNRRMDANTLAKLIVDQAVGDKPIKKPNPRAATRGVARAKALSPEKRKTIATKAANTRWAKKVVEEPTL
jgi:hypothetical protein